MFEVFYYYYFFFGKTEINSFGKLYVVFMALKTNTLFIMSCLFLGDKDGSKVTTVVATTGSLPDRTQEIGYTDTKVIGNGSFGVVYQARMCDSTELVAIKKVLQDKRFKVEIFCW